MRDGGIARSGATMSAPDEYDLAAPKFDLLEMRSFRRDATLQYAVAQRSQQLRILFFASSAVVAAAAPWAAGALLPDVSILDARGLAGCAAASLLFGSLAARERGLRGKVLLRMERELAVGDLQISQTGSALGGGRPRALSALRGERRVVAISGSPGWLLAELRSAEVYRRRLEQSGVALVCVAFGEEAAWADASRAAEAAGWLWRPADASGWRGYFSDILTAKDGSAKAAAEEGAFFALSLRGRSCASGVGRVPWDELLGTKLPPIEPLSPSDPPAPASEEEAAVLAAQAALYDALRDVDAAAVRRLCSPEDDDEVLKYDATAGLRLSSQDATVAGETAFSTGLEFPAGGKGASLLCTQRWARDQAGGWRLAQHRTIPYTAQTDAAACLRCDRRGCVALQRTGAAGPAGMPGDGPA
ncbi:hypothetical protein EMIHUDRAFT_102051 [Emiliania huxleyi CCMP1516]|uniref:SnoaL-like domain-containing protein n=2 Tax=Emiliania huxleyi TaxID=2903 RepID=A0A0D3J956_EMIH1|nr:hypothetical protein EMIHUDRAFT_102051 [Emiliania huxleyi CCMP1516]EOD20041.1 hypothetical protein EMIHUDRAFT_102051 [Emiliania huxleyi CCMP1516]|eukprot:XP_005772470.1 hypothetical protein EMIHUDRAFT_102051 [Emiliania huxleyi CCMP1516]